MEFFAGLASQVIFADFRLHLYVGTQQTKKQVFKGVQWHRQLESLVQEVAAETLEDAARSLKGA